MTRMPRFSYANDAASRLFGYTRQELLNMGVGDIDINFNKETWREQWYMLKQLRYNKHEAFNRTRDGSIFMSDVTQNFVEFNGKEYNFAFIRPITPPKHKNAT